MSIIGSLRRNSWIILAVIGLGMLGFILMDSSGPNGSGLSGKGPSIGKIKGNKVSQMDLQNKLGELKALYPSANDDQLTQLAWDELIDNEIFTPRYKNLGLDVSAQELANLTRGVNPHPAANQFFSSAMSNGQYDAQEVATLYENMDEALRKRYMALETYVLKDQTQNKYLALLRNGANAPDWLANSEYIKENRAVSFDYVLMPYSLIKDDEIKVSDEEIKAYALKRKEKYQAKNARTIEYVAFNQAASKADTSNTLLALQNLKEEFKSAERDSIYAISKSNYRLPNVNPEINPNILYQTRGIMNLEDAQEDLILNATEGDVVGPFVNNGRAFMVKVKEKTTVADSAKVRHILVSTNQQDPLSFAKAKNLVDSLVGVLKINKSKFGEFVTEYSEDPGSKDKGGEYGYFPQGQMVPAFNAASFYEGRVGEIQLVQTMYGFHIVEVLSRKGSSAGAKVVPIVKSFTTSEETNNAIYAQAKEFERNSQNEEDFSQNAEQYGGVKEAAGIAPDAKTIQGMGQARSVVKWANDARVGDVSYFNLNNMLVVARLKSKTNEGDLDIDAAKIEIQQEIVREKKAEMLIKRIDEIGITDNLNTLATNLGRQVQKASDAKFGGSGQTVGFEPEVISTLFFAEPGSVVGPLKGKRGVFVAKVNAFTPVDQATDLNPFKTRIMSPLSQKANLATIKSTFIESGVIKDERYKIQ